MKLNEIRRPGGANRATKRRGRGGASGQGGTSGRGHKGQNARSGGGVRPGFEGGQMPLSRRLPKRGFTSRKRTAFREVNLDRFKDFPSGTVLDGKTIVSAGIARPGEMVKILSRGELSVPLVIHAAAFSKTARQKIEAAGGKAVEPEKKPSGEPGRKEARRSASGE